MSYIELLSHPDKKLENHLENVGNFSYDSFNSLKIENNELFSKVSFLIGISHDFAKSTSFFQMYIRTQNRSEKARHSFLSAIFTYFIVNEHLKRKNIKLEFDLAIISYIVVLFHHGDLRNVSELDAYHDKKIKEKLVGLQVEDLIGSDINLINFYKKYNFDLNYFLKNFEEISDEISMKLLEFSLNRSYDNYFYILLFYSVLLDSDKMDASKTGHVNRNEIPDNIVDKFKENNFVNTESYINNIREKAYNEVINNILDLDLNKRILSINLPTGTGKTLTGVSAALKLKKRISKELGFNPRVIYSLPFLSIIDQNEEVIQNILNENNLKGNDYLLKHHYLSEMNYMTQNESYDIDNSKMLIEGWNSEIIVTTFIQLFYSILTNKNKALRKFHNIINSIIILDEIQSIPYEYWEIINKLFKKLAEEFNCWIILMTATYPLIFKDNEIYSLVDNVTAYFNHFDRVDFNFNLNNRTVEDFANELWGVIDENPQKDIMVILNTISSSKELYNLIKEYFSYSSNIEIEETAGICNVDNDCQLVYLSTNLIPKHRLEKINSLKNSNKRNIIITTQLVEAGVDLDVDIIYKDLAPLDSIIQAAGRCNRNNNKNKGLLNVISLINSNGKKYSNFIYSSFLLNTTREIISSLSTVSEKHFCFNASKNYFKLVLERGNSNKELNDILETLKFNDIPNYFQLIKNDSRKFDVFVCVNNEAEEIFENYKYIIENFKGFHRKNEFLKIKNKFYSYVISVDEKKLGSVNLFNEEIAFLDIDDIGRKYELDLGFTDQDDEEAFIL